MLGLEELSQEDQKIVNRARRLERFLTQPFFTTEHFTGLKGKMVKLEDALDGCERILNDEFSDYPEKSLYMIGDIERGKEMRLQSLSSHENPHRSGGDEGSSRGRGWFLWHTSQAHRFCGGADSWNIFF